MPATHASRLYQLYRADFGERAEAVARVSIILISMLLLLPVARTGVILGWALVYFALLGAYWWTVRPQRKPVRFRRLVAGFVLYGATLGAFMALPVYLLSTGIPVLMICACFALCGAALYSLHRPETGEDVLRIDALIFTTTVLALLLMFLPGLDSLAQQVVTGFVGLATLGYFIGGSLTQQRRQIARREAEVRYARSQKARALGQFVGGVAHDFNNQLTAVMGHLELFEILEDPDERRAALRQSREAAERAAMTVKQLLASSGRTRLTPVDLSMRDFLEGLKPLLADLLDPMVTLDIPAAPPELLAEVDRDVLETCVIQLCLNAQDAFDGDGTIRVSATLYSGPADIDPPIQSKPPYVALIVEDDGPGVSPEALNKLAEPFYTTKPPGEGSGLGLSAVAGFARQTGGGLLLESPANSGLRALILLPPARRHL